MAYPMGVEQLSTERCDMWLWYESNKRGCSHDYNKSAIK